MTLKLLLIKSTTICKMEKVIPMSWLNQILLVFSIAAAILSLVVQGWTGLTSLPIYVSISWAVLITIISIWLSCYLLRLTLKANSPIALGFLNKWIYKRLVDQLSSDSLVDQDGSIEITRKSDSENQKNLNSAQKDSVKCNNDAMSPNIPKNEIPLTRRKKLNITEMTREINTKFVEIWYKNISNDKSFPDEAQDLLSKFLTRLVWKASLIDKIKLTNKLANVLLLHLKEYRRYEYIRDETILVEIIFVRQSSLLIYTCSTGHYAESRRVLQLAWKRLTNIYILVLAMRQH